jgi:hypothetical protein
MILLAWVPCPAAIKGKRSVSLHAIIQKQRNEFWILDLGFFLASLNKPVIIHY